MFVRLSILQRSLPIDAVNLSKQKELYVNPRSIQQIEFYGKLKTNSQVCTFLEKSKKKLY